jgi:hypothetical protein
MNMNFDEYVKYDENANYFRSLSQCMSYLSWFVHLGLYPVIVELHRTH